jgi:hypothetical protein
MKNFIADKDKPIIPQIEEFNPKENVVFTGFALLTEEEDILKFFSELTEIHRKEDPEHVDPRESVRAELAYITGYSRSWQPHWERFSKVLGTQFKEAREKIEIARKEKRERN